MVLDSQSSLTVTEKSLFNRSGEQAEKRPCVKVITDTVRHKKIDLRMGDDWVERLPKQKKVEHIGTVSVTFYSLPKSKMYAVLAPDDCTCRWSAIFAKADLPFVKETIQSLSFKENQ
jgi:hypothetical protein